MTLSVSTPIILFPAISLILLAYTEKFVQLARLVRTLKKQYENNSATHLVEQIENLKRRIYLIKNMQAFGTLSFFLCIATIFLLFSSLETLAYYTFWISMILLMTALYLSFREIRLSSDALKRALDDETPR
ncbi:DUF2721 domain-containing protein [Pararcticibacter amylolyticus]|uniref:DUF2721 domain-containing protein n=1 Tax=Pararcticibacter amylolyticus TaxID=2173175 RepID=A0A2U2PAY8_9SPHI|nr:DUF2721 domain-containing protein [Pararcticibacter amylolyticus]PWG78566.1 DUF2721 domain-containing protein [Pararcticibacter amylolyticus]